MAKVKKKAAKGKAVGKAKAAAKAPARKAKAKAAKKAKTAPAKAKKAKATPAKAKPAKAVRSAKPVKPAKTKPTKAAAAKAAPAKAKVTARVVKAVTTAVKAVTKVVSETLAMPAKPAKPKAPKAAKPVEAPVTAQATTTPSIGVGSRAPEFTLKDQSGVVLSSDELRGKPYVLYFYPKDDTSGCTAEACSFRDSGPKFGELGVRVIGVSPDSEQSHAKFAGKYGLPFTLLSDPEKALIQAYGAWVEKNNYGRKYMGVQRSTFLVGADGTVQKAWRGVKVPGHVDAVLAATQN
jgi:thioredoxin-dependent peroxiredoxin